MNNIRALLDSIQSGVQTVSPEKHQQTIAAINKFQDDPALLDTILPRCVPLLTKSFFCMSQRDQKLVAELFYNLDKISHSKVLKSLDTSIFRLNEILNYLQDRASPSSFSDVLCVYLNLSWLSVILLSPYAFKDKFNKTLQVSSRFENYPICIPPINKIKAVLYFKNFTDAFDQLPEREQANVPFLNQFLKLFIQSSEKANYYFSNENLRHLQQVALSNDGIKLLPKLFQISFNHGSHDILDAIVEFFHDHLSSNSTDTRFQLAHSFAKIAKFLHQADPASFIELIDYTIENTVSLLQAPCDSIDSNELHTSLLIIAEVALAKILPIDLVDRVLTLIIPKTCHFQKSHFQIIKGHHIRDSTNFIIWSVIRSNRSNSLSPQVLQSLLSHLLINAFFDPELIIRYSSFAALQELLGRSNKSLALNQNDIALILQANWKDLPRSFEENSGLIRRLFNPENTSKSAVCVWKVFRDWSFNWNLLENLHLTTMKLNIDYNLVPLIKSKLSSPALLQEVLNKAGSSVTQNCQILYLYLKLFENDVNCPKISEICIDIYQKKIKFQLTTQAKRQFNDNSPELFQIFVILKYWQLTGQNDFNQELFWKFVDIVSPQKKLNLYNEFIPIIQQIISQCVSLNYTRIVQLIKSDNELTCRSICHMPDQEKMCSLFFSQFPLLSPQSKSLLIGELDHHWDVRISLLPSNSYRKFRNIIINCLDDYTITQQGDVGRLVRIQALKLMQSHPDFLSGDCDSINPKLTRLLAEPVPEIRKLSYQLLASATSQITVLSDSSILNFRHKQGLSEEFWKGYAVSAGAIHFTDSQLTSSIDSFIVYYRSLSPSQQLELCHDLIRIIPSAKQIAESRIRDRNKDPLTGGMRFDTIKFTIHCVKFWTRIMESGLVVLHPNFNFQGVFAKFYNLHLLDCTTLRVSVIKFFPFLAISCYHTMRENADQKNLSNIILKRLLVLVKREYAATKSKFMTDQNVALQGMFQIFLELGVTRQLQALQVACQKHELENILESDITL
ncbi:tubulin folding cofactor D [Saccharomyces cerevisiae RM11-1a]|uniref:Tubulin folding cofactor D n=1 Tax=Saccharomyces cerevisiae (strain RM11-1a) TaxID=285006 RepID=B3LK06_YEAS1|nr:Cin1p [Saccharomyces cerevisiae YJM1326]EDV10909.1 tubulin folding cofactor D [Saccharomyces cerevisiae RM11-1a]CAI4816137.1 ATM_1a_G0053040.mRNA.1.CDS.1 [Saccharomyces cerevisiae]CAI7365747.1 ATM_1a_G0053040.mRNA.1.CDS.1 [Saccharomyces cerevisiae]